MTWKHLVNTGRDPPPLLVAEMFSMRLEQGDYAAALSYIVNFASVESQVFSRKTWSKFFLENGHQFQGRVLEELVHEGSIVLSRGENRAIEYLIDSCKEFVRASHHIKHVQVGSRSQNEKLFSNAEL